MLVWLHQTSKMLTLILPLLTMDLPCREFRARSGCTYMQSDFALHFLKLHNQILSTKHHPMPFNPLPYNPTFNNPGKESF